MSLKPVEKKIAVIGDSSLCLIGAAAGTDYYVFRRNCDELMSFLEDNAGVYGVYIVSREVVNSCSDVKKYLEKAEALTVIIDSPKAMEKIDPKKYYEELITRFVGMKVSL